MKKGKVFIIIILVIFFLASIYLGQALNGSLDREVALSSELEESQNSLREAERDFIKLNQSSKGVKRDFIELKEEFNNFKIETTADIQEKDKDLREKEIEFKKTKLELASTKVLINFDKLLLESQERYYKNRLLEEFGKGDEVGFARDLTAEVQLRNPTYAEAMELARGADYRNAKTKKLQEGKGFVCMDYVEVLDNAGQEAGIQVGVANLIWRLEDDEWKIHHTINYFDTTDKGRIFFDPMYSIEATDYVEEGKPYLTGNLIKEIILYP